MRNSSDSEPEEEPPGLRLRSHDRPASWLHALKRYVQETDVSSLNLSGMKLKIQEVTSILAFLANSEVTELDLSNNNLKNHMQTLSKLLIQTKIKKLNVSSCHLKYRDILSLMEVLKETQVTDLSISDNHVYRGYNDEEGLFILYLVESHLSVLNLAEILCSMDDKEALPFVKALRQTSLTHLNLETAFCPGYSSNSIRLLFFELKHTSLTHLKLIDCSIGVCGFKKLGNSLRDSKLIELDLSDNDISDRQVDDLFQAIIGSKITSLSLASNSSIRGNNNLGLFLKQTEITHLDLSNLDCIKEANMFSFPDFIKDSSVESLKLSDCNLSDVIGVPLMKSLRFSKLTDLDVSKNRLCFESIAALAGVIKYSNLTRLNFSDNYACNSDDLIDEGLLLMAELPVGSQLKHLDLSEAFHGLSFDFHVPVVVAEFFEKLRNAPITSLNFSSVLNHRRNEEIMWSSLASTQVTHLNLEDNRIGKDVFNLAANLKFTAITHLNLRWNGIKDEGALQIRHEESCCENGKLKQLSGSYQLSRTLK